jgi:hypothetical protein
MNRTPHLPQYYADDKDIYDLLMDGQRRFDTRALIKLARRRGICLSPESGREWMISYLSKLVWSWPELQHLLELTECPERRERLTSCKFATDAAADDLLQAVETVKTAREQIRSEAFAVKSSAADKLIVEVRYSEFDPSRTRLQQRVTRDVLLEFERTPEGYVMRHQASPRATEIAREIVDRLGTTTGTPLTPDEITLTGIPAPELRTQFFVDLMKEMHGYELRNVTAINIARAESDLTEETNEDESQDPDEVNTATEEAAIMLGVVQRVALEGESLLTSPQFQELRKAGFFLTRAVWRSAPKNVSSAPETEFGADFSDPQHCTGFRYDVRGRFERRTRGDEGLKRTRLPVPLETRSELLRLLEDSARTALATALKRSAISDEQADPSAPPEA